MSMFNACLNAKHTFNSMLQFNWRPVPSIDEQYTFRTYENHLKLFSTEV